MTYDKKLLEAGLSFLDRLAEGKPPIQPRSGTMPGLFSVDANMPDVWSRTVAEQTQVVDNIRKGQMGLPPQVDSRGIPINWDYKTAKTGPWGEPLPSRAKGWLPTSEPDFGGGLTGWWNRTLHNITENREEEEDSPKATSIIQGLLDSIGQAHARRDVVIGEGAERSGKERTTANLGVLGTAAAGTIGATIEIIKNSWHSAEGEHVTPLTAIPRVIGEAFRTIGDLAQAPAEWLERDVLGPRLLANMELAQKYKLVTQEEIDGWKGWLGQRGIFPVWGRVATAVMTGKISREEFYSLDNEYRNQEAARIAYTAWKDTAVKEEFVRRVRAGEDSRVLALELENPVDEMVLEFIFDPLNILDIWYTGGKWATKAGRLWSKMNKTQMAVDLDKKLTLLQKAVDLGNEADIFRITNEMPELLQRGRKSILSGEASVATKRGIFEKLQTFNQLDRGEDFASHFTDITRAVSQNPDHTLDVYLAAIEAISDVPETQIAGLKKLTAYVQQSGGRLDLHHVLSDTGVRSAVLFKDLVSDASGNINPNYITELLEKAAMVADKSGPLLDAKGVPIAAKGHKMLEGQDTYVSYEKLTELMSADMQRVLKRRYPVIQDAVKQNTKYKELVADHGAKSDEVIDFLRKNPAAATEPSKALQRLIPFHEKAQKYFYKPSANVQSKIFMGLNPAYMYRNRIGNAAALLVDHGPRAAFRAMAPRFMGGEKRAITSVKEWLKTPDLARGIWRSQTGAHQAFELSEGAAEWGPILRTAAQDERLARVHLAAQTIPRVIKSVFHPKRALHGIDGVFKNEDDVKLFVKLGKIQGKGDIDETMRLFNKYRGTKVHRTLDGISSYDMHFIEKMELDDTLLDILRNEELSQSDIIKHLHELKEDVAGHGLLAAAEPVMMDADLARTLKKDEVMEAFTSVFGEKLGTVKGDEFMRRVNANFQWTQSAKLELRETVKKLRHQIRQDMLTGAAEAGLDATKARKSALDALNHIDDIEARMIGAVDDIQHQTRAAHHAFLAEVRALSDEANGLSRDFLLDIWNGGGTRRLRFSLAPDKVITLGPEILGEVGVTPQMFKEALWNKYRGVVEEAYNLTAHVEVEAYRDAINGLEMYHTGEIAEELSGLAQETDELGVIARLMQGAVVDPNTQEAVVHASKADLEMVLQRRFETITAKSGTAVEGETLTQKLADAKAALAENPNLKIDDVIDSATRDALTNVAGHKWRKLADFMMGEGDEVVGAIPEVSALMNTIENEIDLFNVVRVDGLIDTDKGRSALAVARWSDWSGEGKVTLEVSNELLNQAPDIVQKIFMEEVAHAFEKIGYEDELLDLFKTGNMSDEAALEAASDAFVGIMRGEDVPNAERLQEIIDKEPEVFEAMGKFMPDAAEGAVGPLATPWIHDAEDLGFGVTATAEVPKEWTWAWEGYEPVYDAAAELPDVAIRDVNIRKVATDGPYDIIEVTDKSGNLIKDVALDVQRGLIDQLKAEGYPEGTIIRMEHGQFFLGDEAASVNLDNDIARAMQSIDPVDPVASEGLIKSNFGEVDNISYEGNKLQIGLKGTDGPIEPAALSMGVEDLGAPRPAPALEAAGAADEVAEATFTIPLVSGADGGTQSPARFMHNVSPTTDEVINRVIGVVEDNFHGGIETKVLDEATHARFKDWAPQARKNMERARIQASRQAVTHGDFAMHNYGDRMGMDLMLGYIFPYQFWYSRSYAKWMERAVRHPGLTAAYFRYKDTLAKEHAGLPDWWKYQLNTNELLGMDSDNPIWFNLEALANPIHGLTGVDFTDPKRRIDGWGAWMEDLNKFGPTVWAPFQLATILKYSVQGEEEAASRWAGRILPFSKSIRDVTALADPKGLGVDIDPYVYLFGGGIEGGWAAGIEAYERGRVGRQLGLMMDDPQFNKADVIDATYNKEGELWDIARARTIQERSPNIAFALAPFFFGAGAKPRNVEDQAIDRMYGQMDGLIKQRPNMSKDQYRSEWQKLRQQYPFMDTVLMSKKAGMERDEALAWNVLSRIPPGLTSVVAEKAGVDRSVLDAFYENKGDMNEMTEADRLRFMGSVLEIGGLLDIPEAATQAEWQISRNLYKEMVAVGKKQFGDDIWDIVDLYYAARADDDIEVGRSFLRDNPKASDAMDWKQVMIQNTPLLAAYYTSDERIRQFYKTQMYQTAEELFGKDLWDKFEIYSRLKDLGEDKAAREFWKDNPGLSGYMKLKEDVLPTIEEKVDHFGTIIPEAKPPKYRHEEYDITPQAPMSDERESYITAQVLAYAEAHTDYSGQRTDIRTILRQQADEIWPNTRSQADTYYKMLSGGNASGASEYLSSKEELQARVMWEFDKIQRLDLVTLGQMFQAAGAAPGMEQPLAAPPGIDPNSPLGRLFNDPQGIPEHLWEAYLLYGQ